VNLLIKLHCIDDAKKIWWDVRPHPTFGTLEFRVCDVVPRVEEATAIAALTQAIVVKLHRLYTKNMGFRMYPRALIEENKWRAARWGVEGQLIDFGKQAEVPSRKRAAGTRISRRPRPGALGLPTANGERSRKHR
jgi:carboxylate-amine ligase